MPLSGDAQPRPKSAQLARGARRYRRKVASPKRWQAIIDAKQGPCRACNDPATNGRLYGLIQFHHLVARVHGGDDLADNIVPLCPVCHDAVTRRDAGAADLMLRSLTDAEYAYAIQRGGEDYFERAYGLRYTR